MRVPIEDILKLSVRRAAAERIRDNDNPNSLQEIAEAYILSYLQGDIEAALADLADELGSLTLPEEASAEE